MNRNYRVDKEKWKRVKKCKKELKGDWEYFSDAINQLKKGQHSFLPSSFEGHKDRWSNEKRLSLNFLDENKFINFSDMICDWTRHAKPVKRAINKEGKRIE